MKQNLTMKAGNNQGFFGYRHDWEKPQNWPDFFCQGKFFEVLGKGVAREPEPPPN